VITIALGAGWPGPYKINSGHVLETISRLKKRGFIILTELVIGTPGCTTHEEQQTLHLAIQFFQELSIPVYKISRFQLLSSSIRTQENNLPPGVAKIHKTKGKELERYLRFEDVNGRTTKSFIEATENSRFLLSKEGVPILEDSIPWPQHILFLDCIKQFDNEQLTSPPKVFSEAQIRIARPIIMHPTAVPQKILNNIMETNRSEILNSYFEGRRSRKLEGDSVPLDPGCEWLIYSDKTGMMISLSPVLLNIISQLKNWVNYKSFLKSFPTNLQMAVGKQMNYLIEQGVIESKS